MGGLSIRFVSKITISAMHTDYLAVCAWTSAGQICSGCLCAGSVLGAKLSTCCSLSPGPTSPSSAKSRDCDGGQV